MAYYIKARPEVADYLHLTDRRLRLRDGNYMLWQADVQSNPDLGPAYEFFETVRKIGALALSPTEAKQEQDGRVCRQLPQPTDPRFHGDTQAPQESEPETQETPGTQPEETGTAQPEGEDEGGGDADPEPENESTEE